MSHDSPQNNFFGLRFLFEYSGFLIAGAIAALVWANVDAKSYDHFVHFEVKRLFVNNDDHHDDDKHGDKHHQDDSHDKHKDSDKHKSEPSKEAVASDADGKAKGDQDKRDGDSTDEKEEEGHHHGLTLHFIVNDVLMALFFAIAAKEVWEALLPGGALSNPRKAATPLLATLGGIVGPAAIYYAGTILFQEPALSKGWAIPCATDIAFSYLVARLIFGQGHPAIAFLLLLAIADDAAGLVILAIFYPDPSKDPNYWWLLATVGSMALCFGFRSMKLHSFWWYLLIPGSLCWFSFYKAGIHPALGLVPIIPCMPHAHTDLGLFARKELGRHDTLNEFEHWWKNPVEIILGLFGLVNAGVAFTGLATGTWLVLAGLLLGKPLGITFFTWIAQKGFKLEIPGGMGYRHVVSVGMVAAIGFTVALFVSVAAFPLKAELEYLNAVKMGALLSFGAAIVAYVGARLIGVRAVKEDHPPELHEP